MERRKHPRFKVQFRSWFSSPQLVAGQGMVSDISQGGCRIVDVTGLQQGAELELRIQLPDEESPIEIGLAVVRWSDDSSVGLDFKNFDPINFDRLRQYIKNLNAAPASAVASSPVAQSSGD